MKLSRFNDLHRYLILTLVFLTILLSFCGCSSVDKDNAEYIPDPLTDQAGIINAIDTIVAEYYDGLIDYDDAILKLRQVIPKPEGYPERAIDYIVPWGEGGGSDSYARHIAHDSASIMDQQINIVNMPGEGGEVGLSYLLVQPPDGYTIYSAIVNQSINEAIGVQERPFSREVDFIIRNQGATEVYWVRADSRFATMQDALQYAAANPGQLTIAGSGVGGDDEFRVASLSKQLETQIIHVPYDGYGERISSLLGGYVDIMHEAVGVAIDHYKAGDIRPLAYGGDIVFHELDPGIPAMKELGYDVPVGRWRGIVTVKGVSHDIVNYLHNCFYAASRLPYYRDYEKDFFQHLPNAYLNSADFARHVKGEVETLKELARELGYLQ